MGTADLPLRNRMFCLGSSTAAERGMTVSLWESESVPSSFILILRFCESCDVLSTTVVKPFREPAARTLEHLRILSSLAPPRKSLALPRSSPRSGGSAVHVREGACVWDKVRKVRTFGRDKNHRQSDSRSPAPQSNVLSGSSMAAERGMTVSFWASESVPSFSCSQSERRTR
jgi:hypothetical protein